MRKKISFLILNNTGAPIKQITASKTALKAWGLCLIAILIGLGYVLFNYQFLQNSLSESTKMERICATRLDEIRAQRRQIQKFAHDINAVKSKLVALKNFEKKIRVIANVETTKDAEGLFGVGGSIPEDLEPKIPLTEKHNSLIRDMHLQVKQLEVASIAQEKGLESLFEHLEEQRNILASTPSIRPVEGGWISSGFGYRKSPFTGRREFHKALDIACRKGTPIVATADGIVTFAGKKGLLGKTVVIDHGHGMVTRYGHAGKILKKHGESVKRGETIALIGSTGRSTGPHVHYEVRLNGVPVNPKKYILN